MTIPRIISQMWIGDKPRPEKLMNTWRDKNPSCIYVLWTDENLKNFPFENTWQRDNTPELAGKCDIMRYEILHKYGGIFIDADTECTNELDDFFFTHGDRFTCYEDEDNHLSPLMEGLVTPSFMGCKANDQLFGLIMLEISRMKDITMPAWVQTGPVMFTRLVNTWQHIFPTKIYPSWFFVPNKPHGGEYAGTDKTYARHYFMSTFDLYGKP
jgi:mannosyltransferase OCH1-like enzyme